MPKCFFLNLCSNISLCKYLVCKYVRRRRYETPEYLILLFTILLFVILNYVYKLYTGCRNKNGTISKGSLKRSTGNFKEINQREKQETIKSDDFNEQESDNDDDDDSDDEFDKNSPNKYIPPWKKVDDESEDSNEEIFGAPLQRVSGKEDLSNLKPLKPKNKSKETTNQRIPKMRPKKDYLKVDDESSLQSSDVSNESFDKPVEQTEMGKKNNKYSKGETKLLSWICGKIQNKSDERKTSKSKNSLEKIGSTKWKKQQTGKESGDSESSESFLDWKDNIDKNKANKKSDTKSKPVKIKDTKRGYSTNKTEDDHESEDAVKFWKFWNKEESEPDVLKSDSSTGDDKKKENSSEISEDSEHYFWIWNDENEEKKMKSKKKRKKTESESGNDKMTLKISFLEKKRKKKSEDNTRGNLNDKEAEFRQNNDKFDKETTIDDRVIHENVVVNFCEGMEYGTDEASQCRQSLFKLFSKSEKCRIRENKMNELKNMFVIPANNLHVVNQVERTPFLSKSCSSCQSKFLNKISYASV